ncbi:hypothetical protein [Burkholderia plantarii]|uniref:hypothetical protein n=1 Tax=Burkholderia plantarii TaxID=41899 RepID=UPI001ADEC843|nr:hypothetical protein [Burkholderia plantarii]
MASHPDPVVKCQSLLKSARCPDILFRAHRGASNGRPTPMRQSSANTSIIGTPRKMDKTVKNAQPPIPRSGDCEKADDRFEIFNCFSASRPI